MIDKNDPDYERIMRNYNGKITGLMNIDLHMKIKEEIKQRLMKRFLSQLREINSMVLGIGSKGVAVYVKDYIDIWKKELEKMGVKDP